ncbi:hypothetical protein JZ751_026038 [Albula glossodonta]|uniref:Uncharacterized protein n=1 Tax=Albula glossodonta TaxID=121402 RepID=A0A8T2MRI1_9TELE|nr:hypothetical protein JZ751_026038 [Albula glossodonta]
MPLANARGTPLKAQLSVLEKTARRFITRPPSPLQTSALGDGLIFHHGDRLAVQLHSFLTKHMYFITHCMADFSESLPERCGYAVFERNPCLNAESLPERCGYAVFERNPCLNAESLPERCGYAVFERNPCLNAVDTLCLRGIPGSGELGSASVPTAPHCSSHGKLGRVCVTHAKSRVHYPTQSVLSCLAFSKATPVKHTYPESQGTPHHLPREPGYLSSVTQRARVPHISYPESQGTPHHLPREPGYPTSLTQRARVPQISYPESLGTPHQLPREPGYPTSLTQRARVPHITYPESQGTPHHLPREPGYLTSVTQRARVPHISYPESQGTPHHLHREPGYLTSVTQRARVPLISYPESQGTPHHLHREPGYPTSLTQRARVPHISYPESQGTPHQLPREPGYPTSLTQRARVPHITYPESQGTPYLQGHGSLHTARILRERLIGSLSVKSLIQHSTLAASASVSCSVFLVLRHGHPGHRDLRKENQRSRKKTRAPCCTSETEKAHTTQPLSSPDMEGSDSV